MLLRESILHCIRRLAVAVGDSLHLLEVLGGVVGKLPPPSPLSTAVLECLLGASQAVGLYPEQVRLSHHERPYP